MRKGKRSRSLHIGLKEEVSIRVNAPSKGPNPNVTLLFLLASSDLTWTLPTMLFMDYLNERDLRRLSCLLTPRPPSVIRKGTTYAMGNAMQTTHVPSRSPECPNPSVRWNRHPKWNWQSKAKQLQWCDDEEARASSLRYKTRGTWCWSGAVWSSVFCLICFAVFGHYPQGNCILK